MSDAALAAQLEAGTLVASRTLHTKGFDFREIDLPALVLCGREKLERLDVDCKKHDGRRCAESLELLRRAWKIARPVDKAAAIERVQAAVDAAWAAAGDLNAQERRLGGEGRNGNFDCI